MEAFRKDNIIINIKKYSTESEEHFRERCLFITSQRLSNKNDLNKAITYSRIYINHKYFSCGYSENIMNELDKMIKNIYTE